MKILSILLANTLLASSGASSLGNITNKNVFASTQVTKNSNLNHFVEVGFTVEDYIYFQEDNDAESILDYVIKNKEINFNDVSGKKEQAQIQRIMASSLSGGAFQKAASFIQDIISKTVLSVAHDVYEKEVEEISSGSSSSGGGSSNQAYIPTLNDWKASADGQAKLNAYIADANNRKEIVEGWKTMSGAEGLSSKAQSWIAQANGVQEDKSRTEWLASENFRSLFDAWAQQLSESQVTDDLMKDTWYFNQNYLFKVRQDAANNKYPDQTEQALDLWFGTDAGVEAARHFAANAPYNENAKPFFDYWKNNGDNYQNTVTSWIDKLITKDDGTKRVKPSKNAWLQHGHAAWDTFKIWVEDKAVKDENFLVSMTEDTSFVFDDKYKKAGFKNTQGAPDSNFNVWWNAQDLMQRAKIVRFYFPETINGKARVNNWMSGKKDKDSWGAVSHTTAADKMSYSHRLLTLFKEYIEAADGVNVAPITKWNLEDLRNGTGDTKTTWDALVAEANGAADNASIKNVKARAFKELYENNYFAFDSEVWNKSWYILDRSDLDWSNISHRYLWFTDTKQTTANLAAHIAANGFVANNPKLLAQFKKTPKYLSWSNATNNAGGDISDSAALAVANADLAANAKWVFYNALILDTDSSEPTAFATWKNAYNGVFTTDNNADGKSYFAVYRDALTAKDKKDVGWATFIASKTGKEAYGKWLASKDPYKNSVKNALLKEYETLGIKHYANADQSDSDYETWEPWYMHSDLFDYQARYGLQIQENLFDPAQTQYMRFIYSKYKEHELWKNDHDIGTDPYRFTRLWLAFNNPHIGAKIQLPLSWGNIPADKTSELDTLDDSPIDYTQKPEYQGGYWQRIAYKDGKRYYNDISGSKWAPLNTARRNRETQYISWDIFTKAAKWNFGILNDYHRLSFAQTILVTSEWQKQFAQATDEAYFAFRDKFIDNSNSHREQVTPFSNADMTTLARGLTLAQKQFIYTNSKFMLENTLESQRKTDFLSWAKDKTTRRYSPNLLHYFSNNDILNENAYSQWTPHRIFTENDYAALAAAQLEHITTPSATTQAEKRALVARVHHIPIITYFVRKKAQEQFKNPSIKTFDSAKKNGIGFFTTWWQKTRNLGAENYQDASQLWDHYFNSFASDIKKTLKTYKDWDDIRAIYWSTYERVISEIQYDILDWGFKQAIAKGDFNFDSDYIGDVNELRVSEEIINLDKTIPVEPHTEFARYLNNQKDAIWDNAFTKDPANYRADFNAWKN